jgi:hypothetical protein
MVVAPTVDVKNEMKSVADFEGEGFFRFLQIYI